MQRMVGEELSTESAVLKDGPPPSKLVLEELRRIQESPCFSSSKRGQQFLSFVVHQQLEHPEESLKERTIGVALFRRSADYATGEDSVVRAQAREVRRRLEQYYRTLPHGSAIRIELPVGSYSPRFIYTEKPEAPLEGLPLPLSEPATPSVRLDAAPTPSAPVPLVTPRSLGRRLLPLIALAAVMLLALGFWAAARKANQHSALAQFWSPAFTSSKPLLISLPKPIFYRPSADLYRRTAQRPGEFDREVTRMTRAPRLRPDDTIHWNDMVEFPDYGVSEGDVQAVVRLSRFFATQNQESEVRAGNGLTSGDLRNFPAVVIGAFSNPWAMELMSGLRYTFVDDESGIRIQERGPAGKSWRTRHGSEEVDFGLVTRLTDSSTGQFVVLIAGIEASGSDAAADLIVDQKLLENSLQGVPNWQQKNMQILIQTSVNHSTAGPPKVISVYSW
jgi:hypothetical protein